MQSATSRVRITRIMRFRYIGPWISPYIRRRLTKIAHGVTLRNVFLYVRETFMVACQAVARGQPGSVLPTIYELLRGSAAGLLSGYRDRGVRPASSSARQRCTSVIIQRRDRCERCPELRHSAMRPRTNPLAPSPARHGGGVPTHGSSNTPEGASAEPEAPVEVWETPRRPRKVNGKLGYIT